jgi:hypothetical protein
MPSEGIVNRVIVLVQPCSQLPARVFKNKLLKRHSNDEHYKLTILFFRRDFKVALR